MGYNTIMESTIRTNQHIEPHTCGRQPQIVLDHSSGFIFMTCCQKVGLCLASSADLPFDDYLRQTIEFWNDTVLTNGFQTLT